MPTIAISDFCACFLRHRDGYGSLQSAFQDRDGADTVRRSDQRAHHFCDVGNAHFGTSEAG